MPDLPTNPHPQVTFLISTHNRRKVLLYTLEQLQSESTRSGLAAEIIVIDNDSRDGTADCVAENFPQVRLIRLPANYGACAKNAGLQLARGAFVIFLDDDSHPTAGSAQRMLQHFAANPRLGAAVFDVIHPDGSRECSAYPNVFIGCGTGFRQEALAQSGGLPEDFFMQAEEYDLSLRLLNLGWEIERLTDIQVMHLKTQSARQPARTTRLDTRNNLMLVTRYFPRRWMMRFAVDWMRRYRWIAASKGRHHQLAFLRGLAEGIVRSCYPLHRKPIGAEAFERFARFDEIQRRMQQLIRERGYRSILLVDVGKNILPYYLAATNCGLRIVAIADNKLAKPRRRYHKIPVVDDATAQTLSFDAAVIANLSPVHVARRLSDWPRDSRTPIVDLFESESALAKVA
jgi:GT2 family glycosyltransferase